MGMDNAPVPVHYVHEHSEVRYLGHCRLEDLYEEYLSRCKTLGQQEPAGRTTFKEVLLA